MAVDSYPDEKSTKPTHTEVDNSNPSSISASITDDEIDSGVKEHKNANYGSTEQHIFSDSGNLGYWTGVYEAAKYEGRHRFDALLQWDASEEKRLVRKVCSPYIVENMSLIFCSLISESCFGSG
jgi:hypothetical protein